MRRKLEHFAQKKRQLKGLSRKMKQLLASGEFHLLSNSAKERLLGKARRLYKALQYRVPRLELRKVAAGFMLLGGLLGMNAATAQDFAAPVTNPFGITKVENFEFPVFADIDNDGDFDLFIGGFVNEADTIIPDRIVPEGTFGFRENIGDAQNPVFDTLQVNPFGLVDADIYATLDLVDLDDDGDLDMLVGAYYGKLQYFENTGDAQNPAFAAPLDNPFGLVSSYDTGVPTFGDLDGDGDYDLIVGEYYGEFQYFENTGDAQTPTFAAPVPNPFGLSNVVDLGIPDLVDLDQDGDLDMLVGDYYGGVKYFENTGDAQSPAFAAPVGNPFNLVVPTAEYLAPCTADLDNDGDIDLLVSSYGYDFLYFENIETNTSIKNQTLQGSISLFPNPTATTITLAIEDAKTYEDANLSFYNSLGQMVTERKISSSHTTLDVSDLPTGIYIAKINAGGKQKAIRFTVE